MLDPKLFLKLLQLDLNAHPPGAPILKIHLAAEPARPRSAQGGLFLPPSPEPEKLELTLARIAGLVGESRVGSLELLDTHRVEGFRMRRFSPGGTQEKLASKDRSRKTFELAEEKSAVAALRRFRPPLRATVTLENAELARVVCAKKKEVQGSVLWKAGPWRSSGDWWEREAWSRDEWDIALQNAEGILSTASCTIYSAEVGLWKECMTETFSPQSHGDTEKTKHKTGKRFLCDSVPLW